MPVARHPAAWREDPATPAAAVSLRSRAAVETAQPASIRPEAVIEGTPGDDRVKGTKSPDQIDLSQGGDDQLRALAGDDAIYFGGALTGRDRIDGGGGLDVVTLEGDYSRGIHLAEGSLIGVERLDLLGGSYVIEGVIGASTEKSHEVLVDATELGSKQNVEIDLDTISNLRIIGGRGDDVLHASAGSDQSWLDGLSGDDTLIGGGKSSTLLGNLGADRIVMVDAGDVATYFKSSDSTRGSVDRIDNFVASGGRIRLGFDSDTRTPGNQFDFHLGRTAERVGDIVSHYDAAHDFTVVKVFTDHDNQADLILHLTGDVPLTPADFIFG